MDEELKALKQREIQNLWDKHVWSSPEVINAATPEAKREAVNRIVDNNRGEFEGLYNDAYGDYGGSSLDNDLAYTLGGMDTPQGGGVKQDYAELTGNSDVGHDMDGLQRQAENNAADDSGKPWYVRQADDIARGWHQAGRDMFNAVWNNPVARAAAEELQRATSDPRFLAGTG